MIVSELIALLQASPQDAEVSTEGCDCAGPSRGIAVNLKYNEVIVLRKGDLYGIGEEDEDWDIKRV